MNKNKELFYKLLIFVSTVYLFVFIVNHSSIKNSAMPEVVNQANVINTWTPYNPNTTPRGVYVVIGNDAIIPPYVLNSPDVSGIFLKLTWKSLEKNGDDIYNFTKIDNALNQVLESNQANGFNKKVSLAVVPGELSPDWVMASGVAKATFTELPNWGASNTIVNEIIPAPYDPIYMNHYKDFIVDLANHLKTNQNTYQLITTLKITGVTADTAELRLPAQNPTVTTTNGQYTSSNNPAIWQSLNYTSDKIISSFNTYLNTYAKNFLDKSLSVAIIPLDRAFPNIDQNGQIYQPGQVEDITFKMLQSFFTKYPGRAIEQYNGLSTGLGQNLQEYMSYAKFYKAKWGYQLLEQEYGNLSCVDAITLIANNCNPTNFTNALNTAVTDGASFVEIYPENVLAFPSVLQTINNQFWSPAPKAPTNIKISSTTGSDAVINFMPAYDAEYNVAGYDLLAGPQFTNKVNTNLITTNTYTITNLNANTNYEFKLRAVDSDGNSSPLSELISIKTKDITAPTTPAGLSASVVKPNYVIIDIANPSTDNDIVYRYKIIRDGVLHGQMLGNMTTYIDDDVVPGATYKYVIKAMDKSKNNSPASGNIIVNVPQLSGSDNIPPNIVLNTVDGAVFKQSKNGFFGSTDGQSGMGPVLVKVDDVEVFTSPVKVTNYTFDTTMFVDGMHTLRVVAFDASSNGNKNSDSKQIEIKNNPTQ